MRPNKTLASTSFETEPFSASCRRVLENGPAGLEDYETARYLIEQGLADGRCGPPSKSRDHYGKVTQLVWFGITPAGRLWLEQSARAELDKAESAGEQRGDQVGGRVEKHLTDIAGVAKPPRPNLVKWAGTVLGAVMAALIVYLIRTHLGVSL